MMRLLTLPGAQVSFAIFLHRNTTTTKTNITKARPCLCNLYMCIMFIIHVFISLKFPATSVLKHGQC
jgi:hypothetical protein